MSLDISTPKAGNMAGEVVVEMRSLGTDQQNRLNDPERPTVQPGPDDIAKRETVVPVKRAVTAGMLMLPRVNMEVSSRVDRLDERTALVCSVASVRVPMCLS